MRAVSLEYHDVVSGEDFDSSGFPGNAPASYKLTADAFDRHLQAIEQAVRVAPGRLVDWLEAPSATPLFITFDDGGSGALPAADLLERRGWRGHFFVTAGRVGTPGFLTAGQMRDLHARGHVIGSHSYSHPLRMGGLAAEQILDEWRRSRLVLTEALGADIVSASVPGGFYRPVVGRTAAEAGYSVLFTSMPTSRTSRVDGCLVLGRYTLRRWSTPANAAGLAAGGPARLAQWALYSGLHLARMLAGNQYTRLRQLFWARRG
jgi:peptidoglycan/xylan/chitin deacetylase (PgdA/CDA1 family)